MTVIGTISHKNYLKRGYTLFITVLTITLTISSTCDMRTMVGILWSWIICQKSMTVLGKGCCVTT